MKRINRLTALALALIMVISCAPISIFASSTANEADSITPVADTYISAVGSERATVFGNEAEIFVDNQHTYFVTFKTSELNGANKGVLCLPLEGAGRQTLDVYLIDGYTVDEGKLCYDNAPALDEDMLVVSEEVGQNNTEISLISVLSKVKGEYFTLAIKGSANYLKLDFEEYSAGTSLKVFNSATTPVPADAPVPVDGCSSDSYVWRTGGATGAMKTAKNPDGSDDMVATVTSSETWNRIRWYNTFLRDKAYFDADDIGRVYDMSFDLRIKAPADGGTLKLSYDLDSASGTLVTYNPKPDADTWKTYTKTYTVTEDVVFANGELTKKGLLSFTLSGAKKSVYYFDDITVIERAPSKLASKEAEGGTAFIEATRVSKGMALADTYVSAMYPADIFGKEDNLIVRGGAAESILFATFSSELVEGGEKLALSLPASASADARVEIFLLDGYIVNENALTYENMPSLEDAISLGEYDIINGSNTITLDSIEVESDFFTIAMVAEGEQGWRYYDDFEERPVETLSSKPEVNREIDPVTGFTHAYNFSLSTATSAQSVLNKGGEVASYAIKRDADDGRNQVVYTKSHSSSAGRLRFYNALNDSLITKESPIVGKTFRISARVKALDDKGVGRQIYFNMMPAYGSTCLKDAGGTNISGDKVSLSTEWQTMTIDYTMLADHVMAEYTSNGVTYYNYPMVSVEVVKASSAGAYEMYIDDLSVVELTDADALEFVSTEGAENAGQTITLTPIVERGIVADTYISSGDKDGVFGYEEKAYVDNKRTYLVSFKTADFTGDHKTYLVLPLAGEGSQTVSMYLLDSFKVDEASTSYNNTPALDASKLVESYEVLDGGLSIKLEPIAAQAQGEYFTLAFAGTAHYFELDFNEYTSETTVGEYDNNVVDTVETDRSHMYAFADESKITSFKTRRGGTLGTRKITSVSGEWLLSVPTATSVEYGGYLKFYNALNDSVDDDIIGKTFKYSVDVKLSGDNSVAEAAKTKPAVKAGIIRTGANDFLSYQTASYDMLKENGNGWVTLAGEYTVSASEIGKEMSSQYAPKLRFSYPMFGMSFEHVGAKNSGTYTYYVDNIKVAEAAPTEIASREGDGENRVLVYTGNDVAADTYVSKAHPDACYGTEAVIKLGDKNGDKKAAVLSFMNSDIVGKNYVDLNLVNNGDTIKDVHVYYILNYLADESSLTWNTMPEYENNLLGVYDIGVGDTRIDLSRIKDKLEGEYFTLVLRTENHTFYEDFESYPVGTALKNGTSHDNDETDPETGYTHTHTFAEQVYYPSENIVIIRRNGDLSYHKVEADAENSANQLLRVMTSTSQNYDGAIKFYNALNDEAITKDSDIIGKTFRFTAKIKLDEAHTNQEKLSTVRVTAGALTSKNNKYRGNKSVVEYDDIKDGWATLSVDYTVVADHVREEGVSADTYTYPMLSLYFGDDATKSGNHGYFVDDVSVVEVVDGVAIGDAEFGAREAEGGVFFVSALNGNVTVLEATASGATNGNVISIVEGDETYSLLKADAGKLMFGNVALCDQSGNDYLLGNDAVKVVAIYDDINGTVRFAVGDYLAYYKDGDQIKATFELPAIEGGVGDGAALGEDGINASKLVNTTSEIIGFQTNYIERAVRFISGVDAIYYNAIGFKLETADNERLVDSASVYSAVTADGKYVYAKDFDYNLMSAIAIKDVKNGAVVKVTPFLRVGDNYIYGEGVFYKIMVGTDITVVETNESEFGTETNANLASVKIDGEALAGFNGNVTEYNVPAADPQSFTVEAVAEESEAKVTVSAQDGNTVTVTVVAFNGIDTKTYTFTAYGKVESQVVNKNGADATVTYVFDDGDTASATIVTKLSENYPSITGSFALVTNKIATLSTIEGVEGDGLLEYEFDEDGNYVYTKIEDKWSYWEELFVNYPAFEGVNHTHTHAYIGEDDNGGSFVYKSTAGNEYTSRVFPKGNVTKEYYASNQILRELGQRALTMVGAGLTAPDGNMINYTESYKNLPQTSGAFIGKRATVNSPKKPADMLNIVSDLVNEDNRFGIKAYMVQHYAASPEAPTSTSAEGYSREACLNAGVGYWTTYIDKAVEMGEWAAFCFHNVKADSHTGTSGHFVFESQLDQVFKHTDDLAKENKVWVASFTDACLYNFARSTSTVSSYVDGDNVVVTLSDKEDDSIFTMPLTVKVALPEGKSEATLDGKALTPFTENGAAYVYVDVAPETSVTIAVK